tara:strand:+ start:1238 stop:1585 length:348 start_codon:yes stop_codon:yes gene_type:complete
MIEITDLQKCSQYFYVEQIEQIMDHIENTIKTSDYNKELKKEYKKYENNEKVCVGFCGFPDVKLKDGNTKNISVEYSVKFKLKIPALSIMRITIYDEIGNDFLDKMIEYKRLINE